MKNKFIFVFAAYYVRLWKKTYLIITKPGEKDFADVSNLLKIHTNTPQRDNQDTALLVSSIPYNYLVVCEHTELHLGAFLRFQDRVKPAAGHALSLS